MDKNIMEVNGLKRVILIDSYLPNVFSEIRVDGHTNITGRNGLGKTSFLRLLPIFYGENPGGHVKRDEGGNKGFAEYYLPRLGSYIVFEYLTHSGVKTVVFTSVATSDAKYRQIFIDAELDLSLFVNDQSGDPLPASSLISRITEKGYPYLPAKTNKEYREIMLESGRSQYSMAKRGKTLSNLTPLLSSMFKKEANFEDLAIVIQEWCQEPLDNDSKRNLENFTINKSDIESWLLDFDAISKMGELEAKTDLLAKSREKLSDILTDLSAIRLVAKGHENDNRHQIQTLQEEVNQLLNELIIEDNRWVTASTLLADNVLSTDKKFDTHNRALKNIESEFSHYQNEGVPTYKAEIDLIKTKENELDRKSDALRRAKANVSSIETVIAQERTKIESDSSQENDAIATAESMLNMSYLNEIEKLNAFQGDAVNQFDEQTQLGRDDRQSILNDKQKAVITIQTESQIITAAKETLAAQAGALKAQGEAQEEKDILEMTIKDKLQHIEKLKLDFKAKDDDLDFLEGESKRINMELARLIKHRDGEAGTLFNFLNEHVSQWRSSIGKVVREEVLFTKGLSPSIVPPNTSLFGVELDLNALSDSTVTTETLHVQIALLDEQLKNIELEKKAVNAALTQAESTLKSETDELNKVLNVKLNKLTRDLTHLKESYNRLSRQVDLEKEDFQKKLLINLEVATHELKEVKNGLSEYLIERDSERKTLEASYKQRSSLLKKQHDATLAKFTEKRKEAVVSKVKELSELDKSLQDSLKGKGIDPTTITSLEKDIENIKRAIAEARKKEGIYTAYLAFMNDEYVGLEAMRQQLAVLTQEVIAMKKLQAEAIATHNDLVAQLRQKQRDNEDKIVALDSDSKKIRSAILTDDSLNTVGVIVEQSDIDKWKQNKIAVLVNEYAKISSELHDCKREVVSLVTDFSAGFTRFSGSICYNYWSEHISPEGRDQIVLATAIAHYYESGEHKEQLGSVTQRLQLLSGIDIYRRHIEMFESRVRDFNRKLNNHIGESMAFNAISDIQVSVEFSPNKLDHWTDIKDVSTNYQAWCRDESRRSSPDKGLVDSLRNFAYRMPSGVIATHSSDLWQQIRFSIDLIENGNKKRIDTEHGLKNPSSNGLSYLILIVVFLGFIDMQRPDKTISLAWSLDELGNIDEENTQALLALLTERNVFLISACPHVSYTMQSNFNHRYRFDRKNNRGVIIDLSRSLGGINPFTRKEVM